MATRSPRPPGRRPPARGSSNREQLGHRRAGRRFGRGHPGGSTAGGFDEQNLAVHLVELIPTKALPPPRWRHNARRVVKQVRVRPERFGDLRWSRLVGRPPAVAPVNLTPIAGLERHLHRRQGDARLPLREVREAVLERNREGRTA